MSDLYVDVSYVVYPLIVHHPLISIAPPKLKNCTPHLPDVPDVVVRDSLPPDMPPIPSAQLPDNEVEYEVD